MKTLVLWKSLRGLALLVVLLSVVRSSAVAENLFDPIGGDTLRFAQRAPVDANSVDSESPIGLDCQPISCCQQFGDQSCCELIDCCRQAPWHYASINIAGSFLQMDQGGINNLGGFGNGGASDRDESYNIGGALGIAYPCCGKTLRVEVQAMYHDVAESMSGRFIDDFGFFDFTTSIEDRWTVTGNLWYDIPVHCKPYDVYIGGGVGAGGGRVAAMDPVYMATGSYTDFTWQVGGGIVFHTCHGVSIDLGYRYIDYGGFDLPLVQIAGGAAAGNYTSDLTAHQIMCAIRFNSLGDLLHCRR